MFYSLQPMGCSMPGFPVFHHVSELAQTPFESMMLSNHLVLCRPLLLLHSIFPNIRFFSNKSVLCIRWPKYWSFNFSISPSNEYSGLISFRMDWFDLLAVQGTLESLLQHHSSKGSILWCSAFFIVQRLPLFIQLSNVSCQDSLSLLIIKLRHNTELEFILRILSV